MEKQLFEIIEDYKKFYPHYTLKSLKEAIYKVKEKFGYVDANLVDYFMRDPLSGGLGYGILEIDKRKIKP